MKTCKHGGPEHGCRHCQEEAVMRTKIKALTALVEKKNKEIERLGDEVELSKEGMSVCHMQGWAQAMEKYESETALECERIAREWRGEDGVAIAEAIRNRFPRRSGGGQ